MKTEHAIRREVADLAKTIWERGWVANHDGNLTALAAPGRIVATPTAMSKRLCSVDQLIVVDDTGRLVQGRNRPFSEIGLHLAVYRARRDVRAVLHAHAPHATALAVQGRGLKCFLPEAVVSLGREIPLVPFCAPTAGAGKAAEAALTPFLNGYDAVLLENHGALTWGVDVEQAFLRMELVEHLARISHIANHATRELPPDVLVPLLEARAKAGLGPEGRAK